MIEKLSLRLGINYLIIEGKGAEEQYQVCKDESIRAYDIVLVFLKQMEQQLALFTATKPDYLISLEIS
jgi:hypothetical protein